jgi:hypothetical protein
LNTACTRGVARLVLGPLVLMWSQKTYNVRILGEELAAIVQLHYRGSTLLVRHMRNYQYFTLWQMQSAAVEELLPRRRLNMEPAAQQPLDSPEPLSSAQGRSWAALETPTAPAAASPAMLRARAALITGNEDVRPKDAPMSLGCCKSRI